MMCKMIRLLLKMGEGNIKYLKWWRLRLGLANGGAERDRKGRRRDPRSTGSDEGIYNLHRGVFYPAGALL